MCVHLTFLILVEWCCSENFKPVVGDFILTDLRSMEYIIPDLDKVCVCVCTYACAHMYELGKVWLAS